MTTSTSRPPSAASTASRWPGRNASNPNSSRSAAHGSVARATGACGSGPRPGRVSGLLATLTRTDDHIAASGGVRAAGAESSHLQQRQGALERVLGLRGALGLRQRVVAGEAGVAVHLPRALDRRVHAVERQVRERVAAQLLGDLL